MDIYTILSEARIPFDRIKQAEEQGKLEKLDKIIKNKSELIKINKPKLDNYLVGIVGTGDFAVALGVSFIKSTNILFYDRNPIRSAFLNFVRISTNRSFSVNFDNNIDFTTDIKSIFKAKYIVLAVPSSSLPSVVAEIKKQYGPSFKSKKYVLVSKGFVGKGYLPHRWLQKQGVPFENIIWVSGGNVASQVVKQKKLPISIVSINKNKEARHEFAKLLNKKYFKPIEYSGSALLAASLGGILKNFYAGLGRYLWLQYGDNVLHKYKEEARREFVYIARILSGVPVFSFKYLVIKKASYGPSFWEDLDVTIKYGRNGKFGEYIFLGRDVKTALEDLGLVESFKTVFSALALINRIKFKEKKIKVLKSILEIYEDIHIQYLESGNGKLSEDSISILRALESGILEE